jgi:hypothetical protein
MDTTISKKGIWHDKTRNRYRVRVYGGGALLTQTYHKTYAEAEVGLDEALRTSLEVSDVVLANRFLLRPVRH